MASKTADMASLEKCCLLLGLGAYIWILAFVHADKETVVTGPQA